jgi:sugar/nucleoside kinase (ribokinase family)
MSPPRIVLVGGCHRDVVARTSSAFEPGTSCPGTVRDTFGGVARNVAVLVASAGLDAVLASRVGDDAAGRAALATLAAAGVDATFVALDPEAATGTYVALHDQHGELVAAVSDMSVYDRITPDTLVPSLDAIRHARFVFADANLPTASLTALAAAAGPRLAVDAISRAKAVRVLPAHGAGALGFLNLASAGALLAREPADPGEAARALARTGVHRAVVTGGPQAVAVLDDGAVSLIPVPPATVADVTGAGDALIAGALAALAQGAPLVEAVDCGILAARAALATVGALDRLPPAVLQRLATPHRASEPRP